MTFAEFFLLAILGAGVYRVLVPLQRRIERALLRALGGGRSRTGVVIDVTSHTRRDPRGN